MQRGGQLPSAGGFELDDLPGRGDLQLGEQVGLGPGQLGALAEGAGGAGERSDVEAVGSGKEGRTLYIINGAFPFFPGTGNGLSLLKVQLDVTGYHFPQPDA
jgi:hypothetical protein